MPPIAITFHTSPPINISGGPLSKITPFPQPHTGSARRISSNSRGKHHHASTPLYFTITPSGSSGAQADIAKSVPTSTSPLPANTAKPSIRKLQKHQIHSTSSAIGKSASLTPLLQPIVTRCLAKPSSLSITPGTGAGSSTSTPLPSPPPHGKKTSSSHHTASKKKAAQQITWPIIHPYSRAVDTKNDRSTVPSPREIARAHQAEIEKARAREASAAIARAAAVAKRRKGGKSRTNSRSGNGKGNGGATRSQSPLEDKGDRDVKDFGTGIVPTITTEPASKETSPTSSIASNPLPQRTGLKRTRSTGLGISTNTANFFGGPPAVSSPLRAVTGPSSDDQDVDDDNDGESRIRKRSRLSESTTGKKRANTTSPTSSTQALPVPESGDTANAKSEPLPHAKLLPSRRPSGDTGDSTAMRRTISATTYGGKKMARTSSTGSADGVAARDRARREVTLPGRLRDYDIRAGGAVV